SALGLALGGAALGLGLLGLLAPARLRPVYVGLMVLTYPLNWLTSHLLLACLFYCVITPLGVFFRLIGRDVLTRRFRPDRDTYWAPKPRADDVRSYFRPS